MSRTRIPPKLRRTIEEAAERRCGYCLTRSSITGSPMQIDHIVPESAGGTTCEDNLWLACFFCNTYKGAHVDAMDPTTRLVVPLFNPRTQPWSDHFSWSKDSSHIVGLTMTGRATAALLRLNRPELVFTRLRWAAVGWHPPRDLG